MSTTNVRIAGGAFALIFTAYNTAQNYMTTLLGPELGSASLVLVYLGLILATPIAPGVAPRLGLPRTLALGGSGYFFLMVALLHSTQDKSRRTLLCTVAMELVGSAKGSPR